MAIRRKASRCKQPRSPSAQASTHNANETGSPCPPELRVAGRCLLNRSRCCLRHRMRRGTKGHPPNHSERHARRTCASMASARSSSACRSWGVSAAISFSARMSAGENNPAPSAHLASMQSSSRCCNVHQARWERPRGVAASDRVKTEFGGRNIESGTAGAKRRFRDAPPAARIARGASGHRLRQSPSPPIPCAQTESCSPRQQRRRRTRVEPVYRTRFPCEA